MKNLLSLLTVALFLFGQANAQTISAVNPTSGQVGQTVNVSITGTGTNFVGATQARMKFGSTLIYSSSINVTSATQANALFNIPTSVPLGSYDMRMGIMPYTAGIFDVTGSGGGGSQAFVSGKIFLDANSNCSRDAGEDLASGLVVEFNPGNFHTITDANGEYGVWLPLGNYNISHGPVAYTQDICVTGGVRNVNLTVPNQVYPNNDFPLDVIPVRDLRVYVTSSPARPGFSHYWHIIVYNHGNQPSSGTLYFDNDDSLSYSSSVPTISSSSGDTLIWNFGLINPGQSQTFRVNGTVPANVNLLGTLLRGKAWLDFNPLDINVANDTASAVRLITGSYDPNDKTAYDQLSNELDSLIYPGDSMIVYRIRFQNTGTDTAFNIYVRDTLDTLFDPLSFRTLGASHNYSVTMNGDGEIEWFFPNILLVDSTTNEPASHGYIFCEVKYDPGVPIGTILPNTAHIYFDFNPAVITNTTHNMVCDSSVARFSTSGSGNTISFTDQSANGANWLWDFGDGNTSTAQNPMHTYASGGVYTVCQIVSNSCGRMDTSCTTVSVCTGAPSAAFGNSVTNTQVSFTDMTSGGASTWLWDFGDGNTSTAQNPTHTYAGPGTYTVCLIADNGCGTDTTCNTVSITCTAPAPAYTWITGPNTATFTDASSGTFTSYLWNFGDGTTSTAQNPSHTFPGPGTYNVCLVLSGTCGTDSICNAITIVCNPPSSGWSFTPNQLAVVFSNASGNATSWFWNFGDGNTSNSATPTHIFGAAGTYTVCMIATNACGSDTLCQDITVSCPAPNTNFSYGGGLAGMNFIDLSGNTPTSWFWDFGDGGTSTAQNPTHVYSTPGTYTVCLIATSNCGADTLCLPVILTEIAVGDVLKPISVFPNPVSEVLHVTGEAEEGMPVRMVLRDMTGRAVTQVISPENSGEFHSEIPVTQLASGVYFLEIRMGDRLLNRKVTIE